MTPSKSFANAVSINDLNYLLLKRKNGDSIPAMHPSDQFTIFAMIDRFLGGDGLLLEKHQFWDEISPIVPITNDQKFEEMLATMLPIHEDRREKWTIIVFSETFFSDEPCDDAEIEQFMRLCRLLTEKHQKLIISVNFLHKYEGKSSTFSRRTPISKDFISGRGNPALQRNRQSNLRFSNCSLILWNGVPISCYRKTTYTKEGDDLVSEGYGYDFGDFKSYPTPELQAVSEAHKEIAKLFNSGRKQIIAAKTCSDIAFIPSLSKLIKLLILTADGSPNVIYWQDKTLNTLVCVSDADRGGFFVINKTQPTATKIQVSSFVFNELFCTFMIYYGDVRDEMVDVGGCC
jgi:predicted amidohydrolase